MSSLLLSNWRFWFIFKNLKSCLGNFCGPLEVFCCISWFLLLTRACMAFWWIFFCFQAVTAAEADMMIVVAMVEVEEEEAAMEAVVSEILHFFVRKILFYWERSDLYSQQLHERVEPTEEWPLLAQRFICNQKSEAVRDVPAALKWAHVSDTPRSRELLLKFVEVW